MNRTYLTNDPSRPPGLKPDTCSILTDIRGQQSYRERPEKERSAACPAAAWPLTTKLVPDANLVCHHNNSRNKLVETCGERNIGNAIKATFNNAVAVVCCCLCEEVTKRSWPNER